MKTESFKLPEPHLTCCDNCLAEVPLEETHTCEICKATLCMECICEDCENEN